MMKANIQLHTSSHYRAHLFKTGFQRLGYQPIDDRNHQPDATDVLLIWNRNPSHARIAQRYEEAGATVLVTENGYVGKTKAIARTHHSGAGTWYVGEEDRWKALGIPLFPWRLDGEHLLVLPQRGIGAPDVAMPRHWPNTIVERLRAITRRPIRTRLHPGTDKSGPTLEDDLRNAWAAVVWGSGAGVKAIIAGIPVFHDLVSWIGAPAASCVFDVEDPWIGDRLPMLRRMAWAQWTHAEIESGEAMRRLLEPEWRL